MLNSEGQEQREGPEEGGRMQCNEMLLEWSSVTTGKGLQTTWRQKIEEAKARYGL
jgi:hypothetical protein